MIFVVAFTAFELGYFRFSIKTMLVLTAMAAILLWLAL